MSWRLSCPRCGSQAIQRMCYARLDDRAELPAKSEWHCDACGESCDRPAESRIPSPKIDAAMGIAVLAMVMFAALYCIH